MKKVFVGLLVGVIMVISGLSATATETTEISIWVENQTGNVPAFNDVIEQFEAAHPGVKVNAQVLSWKDIKPKIAVAIASGTAPDILHLGPVQQGGIAPKGLLISLDERVKSWKNLYKYKAHPLEAAQWDGIYYGVPWVAEGLAIGFNVDMFEQAGLVTPDKLDGLGQWNWQSFLTAAKKLTNAPALYGFSTCDHMFWTAIFIIQSLESDQMLWGKDGSLNLDSEEGIRGWKFMVDLFQEHKVAPLPVPQTDYANATRMFATTRSAMAILGSWDVGLIQGTNPSLNFGMALVPVGLQGNQRTIGGFNTFGIPISSEYPDLAWDLIMELVEDESLVRYTKEGYRCFGTYEWENESYVQEDKYLRVFAKAVDVARNVDDPYAVDVPDIAGIVNEEISATIFGEKTIEEALEAMKERIAASRAKQ